MKKYHLQKNTKVADTLVEIANAAGLLIDNLDSPHLAMRYGLVDAGRVKTALAWKEYHQQIKKLEEKKLLTIDRVHGYIIASLTDEGIVETIRLLTEYAPELDKDEYCLVSFDVPNVKRRFRDQLRSFLKQAGFEYRHRSVWITKADAAEALGQLFHEAVTAGWLDIYTAKRFSW